MNKRNYAAVLLASCALCYVSPVMEGGSNSVELERQRISVACRISAAGGEIILSTQSAAGAEALERWASRSEVTKGDASALASIFKVDTTKTDQLTKAGATILIQSQSQGKVVIQLTARDQTSRDAIHRFLKSVCGEIEDAGKAADHPGNNLGWDAARDTQIDK